MIATGKKRTTPQKRRSPAIVDRIILPKVETPIVSRKSSLTSPFGRFQTPQPIRVRDVTTRKATDDIIKRVKTVKERSVTRNFTDIGVGGVSIGRNLIDIGRKTSKKTVAANDTKQFMKDNFHFGKESFKIDKSKLNFGAKVDLKGDGVGEIKMLKNIIKNPSFSNMRDEFKEVRKSD